jgi:hypothetical protein
MQKKHKERQKGLAKKERGKKIAKEIHPFCVERIIRKKFSYSFDVPNPIAVPQD